MRKTYFAYAYLAAMAFLASCASAPPQPAAPPAPAPQAAAPEPAPAAPAVQTAPAPDELRDKATALRKRAFDLGMRDVVPDDYKAAEDAYTTGAAAYGKDNAASATAFGTAADRFDALIKKGFPLLADFWHKKAQAIKGTADSKSASTIFPGLYPGAQALYAKSSDQENAKDYEAAVNGYKSSLTLFEILYKLCDAKTARESIQKRDFAKWDPSNWSLAEAKYSAAQGSFKDDSASSRSAVDEANQRYAIVVQTAIGYYAADRKTASEDAMARATSIKAQVAVKDEYAAALALYQQGQAKTAAKDDEAAGPLYAQAAVAFAAAYDHAKKKMDYAKDELDSLDALIATSTAAAGSR